MKKFYVGVKGLIKEKRGILLIKHAKGHWDLPGGRIDDDEDFIDTLRREISEELPGAKLLTIGDLQGAFRLHKDIEEDTSLVLLYFLVDVELPENITFSDEHIEHTWVKNLADIPEPVNPEMRKVLEKLI